MRPEGVSELVERFCAIQVGAKTLVFPPAQIGHFNAEHFRLHLLAHLEANELKKETEQRQGVNQITVVSRPAFDHVAFFADLTISALDVTKQTGNLALFGVPTKATATQMANRGYTKVCCTHLGDDTHLPPRVGVSASADGAGASGRRSLAPPGTIIPPTGLIETMTCDDETAAEMVVREFELHVQTADGRYYSPAYMWSKSLREAAGRHPCHCVRHPCMLTSMSLSPTPMSNFPLRHPCP